MPHCSPQALTHLCTLPLFALPLQWTAVQGSGIVFASIKATEGATYTDPHFAANWRDSKAAGLIRCAYHFAHTNEDARVQAQHIVSVVDSAGGYHDNQTMQFMLDLEVTDGNGPAAVWAWTQAFAAEILALTGKPGIIYTGFYFWRDSVKGTSNLNCPLWIASYTASPSIPAQWGYWTFWREWTAATPGQQGHTHSHASYTHSLPTPLVAEHNDNGRISGITGNVDVDYFAGNLTALSRLTWA